MLFYERFRLFYGDLLGVNTCFYEELPILAESVKFSDKSTICLCVCHTLAEGQYSNIQIGTVGTRHNCLLMPMSVLGTELPIAAHKMNVCFGERVQWRTRLMVLSYKNFQQHNPWLFTLPDSGSWGLVGYRREPASHNYVKKENPAQWRGFWVLLLLSGS